MILIVCFIMDYMNLSYEGGIENMSTRITIWHHEANLVMTNSDPEIEIFLAHRIRISEILPWDRKSYLTHAILPRASSDVIMRNCILAYPGTSK